MMDGVNGSSTGSPSAAATSIGDHYRGMPKGGGGVVILDKTGETIHAGTPLTLAEYLDLPEDTRAEIVDGVVRPMTRERRINRAVRRRLSVALEAVAPPGVRVIEDEPIVLEAEPAWTRIPDISVLRPDPTDDGMTNNSPVSAVLLAVEVVSPTSRSADTREKPVEFGMKGVPAYWTVDLSDGIAVTVHRLDDGVLVPAATFRAGDRVADPALPWAAVDVAPLLGHYA
jgi:Uma2 family endonuclease